VSFDLETPFLLVFHLVKGSVVGEWGEREGEAERSSLAGGTLEDGRCQLLCELRELLIPIQR